MADFTILIQVDPYTRVFKYVNSKGDDCGHFPIQNGDRLFWVLDPSITERTFQIDFGVLNPFHVGQAISIRGADVAISPNVNLPAKYVLNRRFKYSVSLGNGWTDDPTCQHYVGPPGPPDRTFTHVAELIAAATNATFNISWADFSEQSIGLAICFPKTPCTTVNKNDTVTVPQAPFTSTGVVTWTWSAGQPDTQTFTLTFSNPAVVPGGMISDPEAITLSLKSGLQTNVTITTVTPDQSTLVAFGPVTLIIGS